MRLPALHEPALTERVYDGIGRVLQTALLLTYRSQVFGRQFADVVEEAMRGASEWTVPERELMSAWVSRLNQCVF